MHEDGQKWVGETWNMDPIALGKAFDLYLKVKLVVVANLYGKSGKLRKSMTFAKSTAFWLFAKKNIHLLKVIT